MVAIATQVSIYKFITGNIKVGSYCYLIADIFTELLQGCSMNSPLLNIHASFLSKPLNLICCHGNSKAKYYENGKISKINSEVINISGIKLKFCKIAHSITLYKKY